MFLIGITKYFVLIKVKKSNFGMKALPITKNLELSSLLALRIAYHLKKLKNDLNSW